MQPGDIPTTPQLITAAQDQGLKQISLTWTNVEQTTTNIYRNGVLIAPQHSAGQPYTDTDIEYNTQYIYAISAVNGFDNVTESPRSVPIAVTAVAIGIPFATVTDLTNYWKAPDNPARAEYLIRLASNRLRSIAGLDIDLDNKAAASAIYRDALQGVVLEAVKRALLTPQDMPAVESYQQTAGPYSENIKYTNPAGDLFFKKSELSLLGLNGGQTLGSIGSAPNRDIYSERIEE